MAERLIVDPPSRRAVRDLVPDSTPARLLAGRDRLGRVEKDAILGTVLAQTAAKRRATWWFVLPAVAAAAIALLVLWPRSHAEEEFGARGGGAPIAMFAPRCTEPCGHGGKLVFDLQGTTGYRYFAAFARGDDGNVIWYWTGKDLATALDRGILGETVVIGDEHARGTYRVYGVFSQTALDREGIKALFDDGGHVRETAGVAVVERELVIR